MIKVINQSAGDFALNIGRIFQYKCACGSFGTITMYSEVNNERTPTELIECPDCDKPLVN